MTAVFMAILLDSAVLASVGLGGHPSQQHNPPQQIGVYGSGVFPSMGPPMGQASELYDSVNQTTRGTILSYIIANPGVYLRELASDLDLSMGVVQYHIWALTKDGQLEDCRTGRFRRFFRAGTYAELERRVISLLKQGTAGRIIVTLSTGSSLTHASLARILGISSQALTWQIGRLREMGVVETDAFDGGTSGRYGLTEDVSRIVKTRKAVESSRCGSLPWLSTNLD